MVPDGKNPWRIVDVEDKETGEFIKVTFWWEKAELVDGVSMFSD